MIIEKKVYSCICDNCKKDILEGGDYSGVDMDWVNTEISEQNWHTESSEDIEITDKHYCDECWSWGDNDEILINENRRK